MFNLTERNNMNQPITATEMSSGYTFQQELLLLALEQQALTGMLMTNPRVTGFSSFAKAVLNFLDDKKAPKTCKNLYRYLVKQGIYKAINSRSSRQAEGREQVAQS
jgi:hypothetical protein